VTLSIVSSATDDRSLRERVAVLIRSYNLAHSSQVVADLPTGADVGFGARTFVTDANATTFRSIVAGSGVNLVPVYWDGTDWRIG
jgi:NAD(P)H-hydrate repair Nnr-like enzyme with NAD(P)H-hydrate epimerase domain